MELRDDAKRANTILTLVVATGIEKVSAIALIAVFVFMSAMFTTIFALGFRAWAPPPSAGPR